MSEIKELNLGNLDDYSNKELWEGIVNDKFAYGEDMISPILDRLEKSKLRCPYCNHKFTVKQTRDYHYRGIMMLIAFGSFTKEMFRPYCHKCEKPLGI